MYEIQNATHTPENFLAGEYPIAKDVKTVAAGCSIDRCAPVKIVNSEIKPVTKVEASSARDYAAAVAAVYTLAFAQSYAADDTVTINGTVYTCVAENAVAANKQFNAGTATNVANSIKDAIALVETAFTVARSTVNVTFTQSAAGTGAIPTVETSVASGCSISETTEYVAAIDPKPAMSAQENTVAGLYGIAADAAEGGEDCPVYLTGEFFADALALEDDVTVDMLEEPFRAIGVFLK